MNQELQQSINTLISEFKTKINDNKANKVKLIIFGIVAGVSLIASIILAIFLALTSREKTERNLDKVVEIKKNPNGTQVLPNTPDLDKTIEEINKDIIR